MLLRRCYKTMPTQTSRWNDWRFPLYGCVHKTQADAYGCCMALPAPEGGGSPSKVVGPGPGGREASDDRVEESLYRNALAGNTTAQIFWLKNRRPDRWRDVQNINADVGHYILSNAPMTEDQWIAERTKVIESKAVSQPLANTQTKDED